MAIAPISVGDTNARAKMNEAIAKANLVDGKASAAALTAGLAAEASARTLGLSAETSARQAALVSEAAARRADILSLPLPLPVQHRPGDAPLDFGQSLPEGEAMAEPLAAGLLRYDENGKVARLTGDGIVAPRHLYAVEPGRRYLVSFVVQRRVNSPDPDNDAIRCGLAWYGQGKGRLAGATAQTVVQDLLGLSVGSGRLTVRAVVSRAAGGDIDVVSPAGARYVRPYVQTFGTLVQNDIEVINWLDITDAVAFAPDVSALDDRIATIESLDLGDRIGALESQVTGPSLLRVATAADIEAATVPAWVDTIEALGYDTPGVGRAFYARALTEPAFAGKGKRQSADGAWWAIDEPVIDVQMVGVKADGNATSGTDNSQAVIDALSIGRDIRFSKQAGRYFLKDVPVSNVRVDLGMALIQPAPGAECIFRLSGRARVYGGDLRDSPRHLLKTTTTTASSAVGDTTVTVTDPSLFRIGGLITLVSSELDNGTVGYGGPKKRVHHTTVTAIAGTALTLAEPVRYSIASGAPAHTSLGIFDVVDGDGFVIEGQYFTTIPLFATVRGSKPTGVSSRGRIMQIQGNTLALGFAMIEGDVSQMDYNFIKANMDYSSQDFRSGFGIKCDATQFDRGPNGGHHFVRVDIVGGQDGFDLRGVQFGGFVDCFADTLFGTGYRFTGTCSRFSIGGDRSWSAFNEKGISIGPSCLDIDILAIYTDNRPVNVPWGSSIDIEVADGAQGVRINRKSWTGSNLMRDEAGWRTVSNVGFERGQIWAEDGTVTAPAFSYRLEQGLGHYRAAAGKLGVAAGGIYAGGFTSQGFAARPGTVAAPGIHVNGDEDTGLSFPAANQIAGSVGGTQSFLFSGSLARFYMPIRPPSYTVATLPAASLAGFGAIVAVSDTSPPTLAMSTGSGWRPVTIGAGI